MVGAALLVVGPLAVTASAHGLDESNYRSEVTGVTPSNAPFVARTIELGSRVELTVTAAVTVTVIGYSDEPYLRVGPDGVFENVYSPAVQLNRDRYGTNYDESADPRKAPKWERIGDGPTARWHDHRTHWMQPANLPPMVQGAESVAHRIVAWSIPMTVDGSPATIEGTLDWVPAPDRLPWLALISVGAVLVVLIGRIAGLRRWFIVATSALSVGVLAGYTAGYVMSVHRWPSLVVVALVVALVGLIAARFDFRLVIIAPLAVAIGAYSRLSILHHALARFPGGVTPARAVVCAALALALGSIGLTALSGDRSLRFSGTRRAPEATR